MHHRAEVVITEELDKIEEKEYINKALKTCGYPHWALIKAISHFAEKIRKPG